MKCRYDLGDFIRGVTTIPLPSPSFPVLDYEVGNGILVAFYFMLVVSFQKIPVA